MFSISPVTLLLFTMSLFLARLARPFQARTVGLAGFFGVLISFGALFVLVKIWITHPGFNDKWIGLGFLGLTLSLFTIFIALMLSTKLDEKARFIRVAGIWLVTLLLFLRGFPRDYGENLWFMDITNKMLQSGIGENPGEWTLVFAGAFGNINLLVARTFIPLLTCGVMALAYCFSVLFAAYFRRAGVVGWRHITAPRAFPAFAALVLTAAFLSRRFGGPRPEANFPDILFGMVVGVYLFLGVLILLRALSETGPAKGIAAAFWLIAFLAGQTLYFTALAGLAQNLFGVRHRSPETTAPPARATRFMEGALSRKGLVSMVFCSFVLLVAFGVTTGTLRKEKGAYAAPVANAPPGMRRVLRPGGAFFMDIYEYPNRAGAAPRAGVSFRDARKACANEGKRLCTPGEWESACRGPANSPYEFAADQAESRRILNRRCNVLPIGVARAGIAKSGAMDCENALGLRDMTGNLWEWVDDPRRGLFRVLKGGSHQYNDDRTTACDFEMLLMDGQVDELALDAVGFRCCKAAP